MLTLDEKFFEISTWATEGLTVFFGLIFLLNFFRLNHKHYSLYMVMILWLANALTVATSLVLTFLTLSDELTMYLVTFRAAIYDFGLCWTTGMALLVSTVLAWRKNLDASVYSVFIAVVSLVVSMLPAAVVYTGYFGITIVAYNNREPSIQYPIGDTWDEVIYFVIFDGVQRILPLLITLFCYFKSNSTLNSIHDSRNLKGHVKTKPHRILCFLIIQFVCFFPGILGDVYFIFFEKTQYTDDLAFLVTTLQACWAFLNLLAYWLLKPSEPQRLSIVKEHNTEVPLASPVFYHF